MEIFFFEIVKLGHDCFVEDAALLRLSIPKNFILLDFDRQVIFGTGLGASNTNFLHLYSGLYLSKQTKKSFLNYLHFILQIL